ncbi:MAG: DUF4340 domain-containing protein [Clostridiales bacterium]|nr:DUF4340 domain-containing protein [Clostridiales bacterium]
MSNQKTTGLTRQWKITLFVGVAALLLIIAYFAFFSRVFAPEPNTDQAPHLLNGEQLGNNNRIYVYEPLDSSKMQKIEVNNQHGGYTFTKKDNQFVLEDNENVPYDTTLFASLAASVGHSLALERIIPAPEEEKEPDSVDFANYGLDEESAQASYTVTSLSGVSYTVYIGYAVSSGQGYYIRLEGRNAVYITTADLSTTVLASVEDLVSPILTYPASEDDYGTINNFTLWKNGEHFTTVHYFKDQAEAEQVAAATNYTMTYKQNVSAHDVTNAVTEQALNAVLGVDVLPYIYTPAAYQYAELLKKMTSFKGSKTVAINKEADEEVMPARELLAYGLNPLEPAYELFYTYKGVYNDVIFSEKTADGTYYAYSYVFDIIVEISGEDASFLEWSLTRWIEPAFFQKNIQNIASISIESERVNAHYELNHEKTTQEGKKQNATSLTVYNAGKKLDETNFREFFKVLLTRNIRGVYTKEHPSEDTLYLTMSITTKAGLTTEYKFYRESTQVMYMTVNGEGEFYLLTSSIQKLENDAIKVINGEKVIASDPN